MSDTGFTPGPWKAQEWTGGQYKIAGPFMPRGGTHRRIAMLGSPRSYSNPELDAEILANANLIAAAPDLFEALETLLDQVSIGEDLWAEVEGQLKRARFPVAPLKKAVTQGRATLRKARGQS